MLEHAVTTLYCTEELFQSFGELNLGMLTGGTFLAHTSVGTAFTQCHYLSQGDKAGSQVLSSGSTK